MNLKIRLTLIDIGKLIFGGSVLVADQYNNNIYTIQKGEDTYVAKN